jgi:hypothetical protein
MRGRPHIPVCAPIQHALRMRLATLDVADAAAPQAGRRAELREYADELVAQVGALEAEEHALSRTLAYCQRAA